MYFTVCDTLGCASNSVFEKRFLGRDLGCANATPESSALGQQWMSEFGEHIDNIVT